MPKLNRWSAPLAASLVVLSLAIATSAIAKSLKVITTNETNQKWNAKECVKTTCKSFVLNHAQVSKLIPEPSSGTAYVVAYFTDVSTVSAPISCSKGYTI